MRSILKSLFVTTFLYMPELSVQDGGNDLLLESGQKHSSDGNAKNKVKIRSTKLAHKKSENEIYEKTVKRLAILAITTLFLLIIFKNFYFESPINLENNCETLNDKEVKEGGNKKENITSDIDYVLNKISLYSDEKKRIFRGYNVRIK